MLFVVWCCSLFGGCLRSWCVVCCVVSVVNYWLSLAACRVCVVCCVLFVVVCCLGCVVVGCCLLCVV